MSAILVLHGPNLNLLGTRETSIYGNLNLQQINERIAQTAARLGRVVLFEQSNAEHELVNTIQQAPQRDVNFILFNPAAFTHTSVSLRDALVAIKLPFIEVHLSNIQARETFRHHSYFSDIAVGVISGFGAMSYELAIQAAHYFLTQTEEK